jgi:hypothetical protein
MLERTVDNHVDTCVDDGLDDILSQALDMLKEDESVQENTTSDMTETYGSISAAETKLQSRKG